MQIQKLLNKERNKTTLINNKLQTNFELNS